jgi:hypothetical protein
MINSSKNLTPVPQPKSMDSKFYFLATICLIGGLVGGYLIASTTLQNQNVAYELKFQSQDAELTAKDALLQAKDTQLQTQTTLIQSQEAELKSKDTQLQAQNTLIQTQENLLQQLKANVTKLQIQIEQLAGQQAQTQVRIDSVTWGSVSFSLDVRNTGSVDATLESVSIRRNTAGSQAYVTAVASSVVAGNHMIVDLSSSTWAPSGFAWVHNTSYVIRVTTNTGFYYEAVFTSPTA